MEFVTSRTISTVLALSAALIVVPALMRSHQHVDLRDRTRLSIRLNWQSEAPTQKDRLLSDHDGSDAVAPAALVQQPHAPRVTPRVRAKDEPVSQSPFDKAPDPLRGPPSLLA